MTVDTSIDPPGAAELRRQLADHLASTGAARSPRWQAAFAATPRHLFAPAFTRRLPTGQHEQLDQRDPDQAEAWLRAVYSDDSLVIQFDQGGSATSSSSQPTVMAFMLEALDVADGNTVLEVGTGTGYNSALLCHALGDNAVSSVDIDPTLVDQARSRLAALGYHPALTAADGLAGWADRAPFDRIIGTCSTHRVPAAWLAQTRPGGIIVANVGHGVVPLRVGADGSASGRFIPEAVAFVDARPADAGPALPLADAVDVVYGPGDQAPAEMPDGIGDEEFWFWVNVAAPGLTWFELLDDDGDGMSRCLVDPVTRSWYRLLTDHAGHTTVTQAGPRRLFDELRIMHDAWTAAGRPARDRLGLTVDPDGAHTLWVDEPGRCELGL